MKELPLFNVNFSRFGTFRLRFTPDHTSPQKQTEAGYCCYCEAAVTTVKYACISFKGAALQLTCWSAMVPNLEDALAILENISSFCDDVTIDMWERQKWIKKRVGYSQGVPN